MKKFILLILISVLLMIGCPFIAVKFASDAGMAVCFLLFYAVNPLFSVFCGIFSGADIRRMWSLPLINAVLFLAGVWIFFDLGEPAFLLYSAIYLGLGVVSMLVSSFIRNKLK